MVVSVVCNCGLLDRVSSVGRVEESILDLILVMKSSSSLLLLELLLLQNEVLGVPMEVEYSAVENSAMLSSTRCCFC